MIKLLQNLMSLQELEFADVSNPDADASITKLRQKIPSPILKHYDRLTDQGKKGVALVRHQVCTGCHMRIPIGAIVTLMQDTDIQVCENCGRYLYLDPQTEAPNQQSAEIPAKPIAVPEVAAPKKPARARRKSASKVC
jgi:predicted  nucleic acid-binding Zn-ribbon protein